MINTTTAKAAAAAAATAWVRCAEEAERMARAAIRSAQWEYAGMAQEAAAKSWAAAWAVRGGDGPIAWAAVDRAQWAWGPLL